MKKVNQRLIRKTIVKVNKEKYGCELIFEPNDKMFDESLTNILCIVLDISGSMGGKTFKYAKEAINSLLYSVKKMNCEVLFFQFSTECSFFDFSPMSFEDRLNHIRDIKCGGNTSFYSVFRAMKDALNYKMKGRGFKEIKFGKVTTIFFTDGVENMDKTIRRSEENIVYSILKNYSRMFDFHCIGFTKEHDAKFLVKLSNSGLMKGSFQFIENAKNINSSLLNVVNLISFTDFKVEFRSKKRIMKHFPIFFQEMQDGNYKTIFYPNIRLLKEDPFGCYIEFNNGNFPFQVEASKDTESFEEKKRNSNFENIDTPEKINICLEYYQTEILTYTTTLVREKGDKFEFSSISYAFNQIKVLDESVSKLIDLIKEQLYEKKNNSCKGLLKEYLRRCFELKKVFNKFFQIIEPYLQKKVKKGLTNGTIADLNSLAYGEITKNSFKKKMNKRLMENLENFKELEKKLEDFIYEKEKVEEELKLNKSNFEDYECFISQKNVLDCLEDKDILCIGFEIKRDKNSLINPNKVKIVNVDSSLITLDTFLETLVYNSKTVKPKKDLLNEYKTQYSLTPVLSNEKYLTTDKLHIKTIGENKINGIFPLYLVKKHWDLVKLKYPSGLGYTITGDPLGYTYNQYITLPFLLLSELFKLKTVNEFRTKQYEEVKLSACIIFNETKMKEQTIKELENYVKDPYFRTVDVIPRHDLFFAKLICLLEDKESVDYIKNSIDIKTLRKCLFYITEEELRRVMKKKKNLSQKEMDQLILKLLNLNSQNNIPGSPLITKTSFENMIQISQVESILKEGVERVLNEGVGIAFKNLSEDQKNVLKLFDLKFEKSISPLLNIFMEIFNWAFPLQRVWKFSMIFPFVIEKEIEKEKEKIIKFSLLIQNYSTLKNSLRKKYIKRKEYLDPLVDHEKIIFKKVQEIEKKVKKKIKKTKKLISKNLDPNAIEFALTKNLTKAAHYLVGIKLYGNEFNKVIIALQEEKCESPIEKILMIIEGKFGNLKLFSNKSKKQNWKPKRKHIFRLWYNNRKHFTRETSIEVFGKIKKIKVKERKIKRSRNLSGNIKMIKTVQTKKWNEGGCEQYFWYLYGNKGLKDYENFEKTMPDRKRIGS